MSKDSKGLAQSKDNTKDGSSTTISEVDTAKPVGDVLPKVEDIVVSSAKEDVKTSNGDKLSKDKPHDGGFHHGNHSKHHSRKHFDKHSDRGHHDDKFKKSEPVANKPQKETQLLPSTVIGSVIVDRALTELEAPSISATALLKPNSYNANIDGVIRTKTTEDITRVRTGWNPGDNAVVGNVVMWMNEVCLARNIYNFDVIKDDVFKKHIAYYTPRERQQEIDISNVDIEGDSVRGVYNPETAWPWSSRYANGTAWRPYQPQQVDEIKLIPLQGYVIKPSNTFFDINGGYYTNFLTNILHHAEDALPPFLRPDAVNRVRSYVLPMPGFNYFAADEDITEGILVGELHDFHNIINTLRILDGPWGTSIRTDAVDFADGADMDDVLDMGNDNNNLVVNQYHFSQYRGLANGVQDIDPGLLIDNGIQPANYMTYPDLNAETVLFDYHHIYLDLVHMISKRVNEPLMGQLAGFVRNEQAVWHSLIALEQMGTFFRILLHSIKMTWGYGGFVMRKLGTLCYNDMAIRTMSPTRKAPITSFLAFISDLIKDLPYNKYVVDNFKVWFDASMQTSKDPYDENNTVFALRSIFASTYDVMTVCPLPTDTSNGSGSYSTVHAKRMAVTTPGSSEVSQSVTHRYSLVHGNNATDTDNLANIIQNRFGVWLKSNITQSPMFVPHGCPLGDFLYHFSNQLFDSRAPQTLLGNNSIAHNVAQGAINNYFHRPFTMMLDPLNLTGFVTNFVINRDVINQMRGWLSSWKNAVTAFNDCLRGLNISKGCFYYDEKPEGLFDINMFYSSEPIVAPSVKQHILSYIQQSPRVGGRVNLDLHDYSLSLNLGTAANPHLEHMSAVYVTGHRPTMQSNNLPQAGNQLFTGLTAADLQNDDQLNFNFGNLPRLGFPYSSPSNPLDFGTIGDAMYNTSTAWFTCEQPWIDRYGRYLNANNMHYNWLGDPQANQPAIPAMSAENAALRFTTGSFYVDPSVALGYIEPAMWDRFLINHWWYSSIWNIPYYPHVCTATDRGTTIVPGYDYVPNDMTRHDYDNLSFSEVRDTELDYCETYGAMQGRDDPHTLQHCAPTSTVRVLYGCYNIVGVQPTQWVAGTATGFNFNGILLSRINKVSIFTGWNANVIGLIQVPSHNMQDLRDNDGVPEFIYTQDFQRSLGWQCNLLGGISADASNNGGSTPLINLYLINEGLKCKIGSSDLDLSVLFANLAAITGNLRSMTYEGECYPSSDGYGNDLISHPGDQRPTENYGASVPNYASVLESIFKNGDK